MKSEEQLPFRRRIKIIRETLTLHDGFDTFTRWCKINKIKGLGNASISEWLNHFDGWPSEKAEEMVSKLEKAVDRYIEYRTVQPSKEYNEVEQKLLGTQWYLHFYYPVPTPEIKAEFGRNILRISQKGEVTIENIPDGLSPNYQKGEFKITSSNLLILDLVEEQVGAHLHIKAYINPSKIPSEVMLGAFLSNGRRYISSGTVVFEYQKTNEILFPATFSFDREQGVKLNDLRLEIRNFLAAKSLNYLRVPDRVFLFDKLQHAREGLPAPPSTRFIETGKPILFISSPTYSLKDEDYEIYSKKMKALISNLLQKHGDKIDLRFYAFKNSQSPRLEYLRVLSEIRRTSLFCLIYLDNVPSNALIELGMAYAYAKNVRIFAGKDALPRNGFLKNSSEHIILEEIQSKDIDQTFDEIEKGILWTIENVLFNEENTNG